MWQAMWTRAARPPKAEAQAGPNFWRDRLAIVLAFVTVVCLGVTFYFAKDTRFLMPGPLTSGHSAIESCSTCHTKSGSSKLGWLHGLVAGDRLADSKACLTCHKMPDTAFNSHGASAEVLAQSTERLTKVATSTPSPLVARAQSVAFPAHNIIARGLFCSTCHQEHKGNNFDLKKISNAQCSSCHVVKFNSFDGNHPNFENYPFKRRTKIIYDHVEHFGKHFPDVTKKDPTKRIPDTCSSCHNSRDDKQVMAVAPFEQTCTSCHLDQITGKDRVSGPKGINFLSLPGLDLNTLKKKKAAIGEWPVESEAELTPFMRIMISRNARGHALIKIVDTLNLQDLTKASDEQIKAVISLVWEIKRLFYALISGKASDVLGDLGMGGATDVSSVLATDLIASIPRDVIVSAHQQWLPNLGTEMINRRETSDLERDSWITTITETRLAADPSATNTDHFSRLRQDNQTIPSKGAPSSGEADAQATVKAGETAKRSLPTSGKEPLSAKERPQTKAADQTDDLLFPTAEELRGIAAPIKGIEKAPLKGAVEKTDTPAASPAVEVEPQKRTAPAIGIKSSVDPENWAEHGGWYRQDHTIFYRSTGHKDKFIYSWLFLTGPQAPKGSSSPAAAVFDSLTRKDAPGVCTKCHSVDDVPNKGRVVNFSPPSVKKDYQGRFTYFIHEPHFGMMDSRGCLTCHSLEKGRPYLKSYELGNPQNFVSNFSAVKKELCQTCHTQSMARQDCMLCHKYHVDGVITPMMSTRIPSE